MELHLMPQLQCLQQLQLLHFVSITPVHNAQRRQRSSIRRCQSSIGSTLPELQKGAQPISMSLVLGTLPSLDDTSSGEQADS